MTVFCLMDVCNVHGFVVQKKQSVFLFFLLQVLGVGSRMLAYETIIHTNSEYSLSKSNQELREK